MVLNSFNFPWSFHGDKINHIIGNESSLGRRLSISEATRKGKCLSHYLSLKLVLSFQDLVQEQRLRSSSPSNTVWHPTKLIYLANLKTVLMDRDGWALGVCQRIIHGQGSRRDLTNNPSISPIIDLTRKQYPVTFQSTKIRSSTLSNECWI